MQTAKDAAETVHNSMGDIVNTMGDMQEPLRKMYNRLRNISTTSQSLGEQLNDVREDMAWLIQNNAQFQVQTTTILEALPGLIEDLQDYDAEALDLYDEALNDTRSTVDDQDAGTKTGSSADAAKEDKSSEAVSDATDNVSDTGENTAEANSSSDTADVAGGSDATDTTDDTDSADAADTSDTQTLSRAHIEKHDVPLVAASSSVDLVTLYQMLTKIDKDSREFTQVASNLMDNVGDAAEYGADLTDSMDMMIEDLTALHDSLDMYYPDLQASLDDLSELVDRTQMP